MNLESTTWLTSLLRYAIWNSLMSQHVQVRIPAKDVVLITRTMAN